MIELRFFENVEKKITEKRNVKKVRDS